MTQMDVIYLTDDQLAALPRFRDFRQWRGQAVIWEKIQTQHEG